MPALYVSTKNRDKLRELSEMLGPEVTVLHPGPDDEDVDETGETLWENALLKARTGYDRSGEITIADDTGLEVDALDGAPGVYSARYAGEEATYADNVAKMIREMNGQPVRTARFRTVIACVRPDGDPLRFDGVVEGRILDTPRGDNGFGYDPIFLPEGADKTLAEMTADEKHAISHRGRAFRAFQAWWNETVTAH